jgi:hypothetical protein
VPAVLGSQALALARHGRLEGLRVLELGAAVHQRVLELGDARLERPVLRAGRAGRALLLLLLLLLLHLLLLLLVLELLLLQELARVTPAEHADAAATTAAAAAMRAVAERVNEDKRRLEQLPALQRTLDGWSGPDLVATSTRLVREGVLTKVVASVDACPACY